jgi:uncharacterized hydrophobic protein (TIGR00271 family)
MFRWLNVQELSPEERRSVLLDLFVFGKTNQVPFLFRQAVLLVLSTIIATAGLISDSAAVVIGAMLIAPLMTPVLAAAAAVVMGWPKRFTESLWLVFVMALGALAISSLMTLISPELLILPEQVLARTRPTFWDLLIALAAGSAGAYTITRKQSGAIPGVAVAVALLPPLASTGILVTSGDPELALSALVLFLTNFVAMVLSGALTFLAVGVQPAGVRARSAAFFWAQLSLFLVLTLAISIPLWVYSERVIFNADYQAARSDVLQDWLRRHNLELLGVEISREDKRLVLNLAGPQPPTATIGELHENILDSYELEDESTFRIDFTWTQKLTGTWPAETKTPEQAARELEEIAALAYGSEWLWVRTDFADGQSTRPGSGKRYVLELEADGKLEIRADCGRVRGKMSITRQTLDLSFPTSSNWFRAGCKKDKALEVFVSDLTTVRQMALDGDMLRLSLRDGTGVISFRRE